MVFTGGIYRVTHKQHYSLRLPPCRNVLKIVKTCDDRSRNVVYIFLGTGQGHNSIYSYTNSLAKQKMILFIFTVAITEYCSAPFVSSCISCSQWFLRMFYLGILQPDSKHKCSLTNTNNVRYGLCTVCSMSCWSTATNWQYGNMASDCNLF